MNAEKLSSSILQQAIEGKLVPQLDCEESVIQIGEEPENVPHPIPKSWKWIKIREIVTKAETKIPDQDFLYIDVASIDNKKHVLSSPTLMSPQKASSRARRKVRDGMVLYATIRPYLQNSCIVHASEDVEIIASTAFAAMDCDQEKVLNKYLLYVLVSPFFDSYVESKQKGVAYPAITDKQFYDAYIPLPPLQEQVRIMSKIEELLPLIEAYGKSYDRLQKLNKELPGKLKDSILQEAIKGNLVSQSDSIQMIPVTEIASEEIPFDIPKSWKWTTLNDIGRWKSGGTPSRSHSEYYENGDIPWLKTGDLTDGKVESVEEFITQKGIDNSSAHINPKGSVLMAMYGATIGKLGVLEMDCATNQACCACVVKEDVINNWYLFYYLLSQRKNFISQGVGGAQPNISRTKIVKYPIPVPPLEEQIRIVARVKELMKQIDNLTVKK